MSATCEYELWQQAYAKVMFHALKYPTCAVNGILLGFVDNGGGGGGGGDKSKASTVRLVDAVPLFHSLLGLAPMLQIALAQVEEFCSGREDKKGKGKEKAADDVLPPQKLTIVGYYHANERVDDADLGVVAKKAADKIAAHCEHACALLVHNKQLDELTASSSRSPATMEAPLLLYTRDSSMVWQQSDIGRAVQSRDANSTGTSGSSTSSSISSRIDSHSEIQSNSGSSLAVKHRSGGGRSTLRLKEPGTANQLLLEFLEEEKHCQLWDFDDHLHDIRRDWLNQHLI